MNKLILVALFSSLLEAQNGKAHTFRGKVTQVDPAAKRVTVLNEPVEGWMGSMTMGYTVSNVAILDSLHNGDQITATVYDGDTGKLYEVALLPQAAVPAAASTVHLEDLEAIAFARHPSIVQAESLRDSAAALARQAGLYPNPTLGYYGDEIRGGHSAGGKQGAFAGQTIVLGGKLSAARRVADRELDQAKTGGRS